jgi:uncharacterized protein
MLGPVFKPVGAGCNMRCDYCFYKNNRRSHEISRMSDNILQKALSQLVEASPEGICFYWHGGEPLLAGLKFYRRVVEIQHEICPQNYKLRNAIQTNGTLLNQEWVDFFKEYNFGIGISLDGPKEIHDKHRKFFSGEGSFLSIMRAVELLAKNDMKVSCLSVVTKESLGKAKEIFDFFYQNGLFSLDFSPCFNQDDSGISPLEYADFMIEIFDIFIDTDDPQINIRFFDNMISSLFGGNATVCSMANQTSCGFFPTIDWNGDVYFCDNYYEDNDSFYLGNLLKDEISFMLKSSLRENIATDIRKSQAELGCLNCKISKICGGGCPRYWVWRKDFLSQCAARRKIVHHITSRITSIIDQVVSENDGEKE